MSMAIIPNVKSGLMADDGKLPIIILNSLY